MREEIQLLKEWLEAPETFSDELPIELDEPTLSDDDDDGDQVLPCTDTPEDLVRVFGTITRPHKREWLEALHANRHNFLHPSGSPRWFDSKDVLEFFNIRKVPNKNQSYPAWVLSNQKGSGQYYGEWFERAGTRQSDDKFRTRKYRIRKEALTALDQIFGGKYAHICQWQ